MRLHKTFLITLPFLALALVPVRDAAACGGCFPDLAQQGQTQVSGHRMILSISKSQTTLWDQITYAGDAQSFAWVLPIKGKVEVGTSSDALFGNLERLSQVIISPPDIICPAPPPCDSCGPVVTGQDAPKGDGVEVIAQEVVGPYESVQLSSQDPNALKTWLTDHNYTIPDDISPTISAYVAEGFNFLALKLTPGQGIKSMKPVRVTTPGASPVLPLRMVAAGAGATVPITLWVLGEGKYVPSNFPWFTFAAKDRLVWDWDKNESNYSSLRQEGFAESSNKAWMIEASDDFDKSNLIIPLFNLAVYSPEKSGYGDGMSVGPVEACAGDIEAMFPESGIRQITVTRLHAELPREALATDLNVEAASDQKPVERFFQVTKSVGTPPPCPVYSSSSDSKPFPPTYNMGAGSGCDCATSSEDDASVMPFGALLALGWVLARRRRKTGRAILP